MVDKYTWVHLGSSHLPSDLLAAFLHAQLEAKEHIQEERRRVWKRYHELLTGWAESNDVKLPVIRQRASRPITCSICCRLRRNSETHWLHT